MIVNNLRNFIGQFNVIRSSELGGELAESNQAQEEQQELPQGYQSLQHIVTHAFLILIIYYWYSGISPTPSWTRIESEPDILH